MIRSLAIALMLCLVLAVPAMGQGSSQDGYIQEGPSVVDRTSSNGDGGGDPGNLPFTGMDLVLVAALGAGLLGVGAGMRRLTRPADPTSL